MEKLRNLLLKTTALPHREETERCRQARGWPGRFAALALAAVFLVVATPAPIARADIPAPSLDIPLLVHKHCEPAGAEGTFSVVVDFEFEPLIGDEIIEENEQIDENEAFDIPFTIRCGDGLSTTFDGDTVQFFGDDLMEVGSYIDGVQDQIASVTISVVELPVPGVEVTYQGCTLTDEPPSEEEPSEPVTMACVITNTLGAEDLVVEKVCLGSGFDATFALDLTDSAGATTTHPLACDAATTVEGLEPGAYQLSETITGPDAESFSSLIVCSDGTRASAGAVPLTVERGADLFCVLINVFDPGAGPDGNGDGIPDIIAPPVNIEIDNDNTNVIGVDNANTNTNANNNDNENENENENANVNNNVNTNTQDQENRQDQDNTNEQTNNIDASPEIDIDLD